MALFPKAPLSICARSIPEREGFMNFPLHRIPQRGGIIFRFLFFICFLFLLFLIYLARHPLLGLAGSFWIVNDKPAASDAIVILGDDNYGGDRATRAAELFKAGMAPHVVASGRYLRPYATIAELEQHDLIDRGVPAAAIVRFDQHAENTKDEAAALAQLISAARLETHPAGHLELPHASRPLYLRTHFPCRHNSSRRGRSRFRVRSSLLVAHPPGRKTLRPRIRRHAPGHVGDA